MRTRTCYVCGKVAEETEFQKACQARADGSRYRPYTNLCKKCASKRAVETQKQLRINDPISYYIKASWRSIQQRAVDGLYANSESVKNSPQMQSYHAKNIKCKITKEELSKFWNDNAELVLDIIAKGGTPTIDRIDDSGDYEISNIQILERKANIHKSRGVATNPACVDKQTKKEQNKKYYKIAQEKKGKNKL